MIFCEDFEFGAVRRCANLVDLEEIFMLKNAPFGPFLATIGFDTAEKELSKV